MTRSGNFAFKVFENSCNKNIVSEEKNILQEIENIYKKLKEQGK